MPTRPVYRLRIFAPRSIDPTEQTILTPVVGAPHQDPFMVTTAAGMFVPAPTPPLVGPAGLWPHEPAGFTAFTSHTFEADFPDTSGTGGVADIGDGWGVFANTYTPGQGVRRASVSDSPLGTPFVCRMHYQTGFTGGVAPGKLYYEHGSVGRHLFFGTIWRPSGPWQGHTSGINKMGIQVQTVDQGSNLSYINMHGVNAPTLDNVYGVDLHQTPMGAVTGFGPDTPITIIPGDFYRFEWEQKMSTTVSSNDGIVRLWVSHWNGLSWDAAVPVFERTNLNTYKFGDPTTPAADFAYLWIVPVWGGLLETKTQDDYVDTAIVYASRAA